jgi:hypothetical protein
MKKLFNGIGSKYLNLKLILIPLTIFNIVIYISGSFIAWDLNPLNWWLFTSWVGRVLILFFEIYVIGNYLLDD